MLDSYAIGKVSLARQPVHRSFLGMNPAPDDLIGVTAGAQLLHLSRARLHQMVREGKLPATLVGGSYVLRRADVIALRHRPKPGHPKNSQS